MNVNKLPEKCRTMKAPHMKATKWWCTMCAPTGGRICWQVCKRIGPLEQYKSDRDKNK